MEEDQKRQKGRIRLMEVADLDAVAKIWLDVNRQAHDFIPAAYWEENFAAVKEMLPLGGWSMSGRKNREPGIRAVRLRIVKPNCRALSG